MRKRIINLIAWVIAIPVNIILLPLVLFMMVIGKDTGRIESGGEQGG